MVMVIGIDKSSDTDADGANDVALERFRFTFIHSLQQMFADFPSPRNLLRLLLPTYSQYEEVE